MQYVRPPMWNASASYAPGRALNPSEPIAGGAGSGRAGSVTSIICTPSSRAATMPYMRPSMWNAPASVADPRESNPP